MGSSQQTQSTTNSSPLAAQMPYLSQAWQSASDAMTKANSATAPTGFTAQMTPDQLATFRQMTGYNSSAPGTAASAGTAITNAGAGGLTNAFNQLNNFKQTGNVDSTIADAQKYADNPAISGMVQAAMRDANQQANDVTLPGIQQGAANSGNINSSRTAIAQGLVQRGLAQQAGDISANLRGQAYNNGLNLAQNANQFSTNANLGAISQLMSGGTNAVNSGVGALSGSINDQANVFGINAAGGAGQQAADQANLTNQNQAYQFGTQSPFAGLNQFYNIVGNRNWGGTSDTSGSTTNNPGALQYAGLGLYGLGMLPSGASGGGSTGNSFLPSSSFMNNSWGW